MELLGERPVWSMSGSEMLLTLDAVDAELARLQTFRLQVIATIDDIGYAKEIGAHDTARLLTFRHRVDSPEAHRDVRLARSLPKYSAVSAALPDTTPAPSPDPEPSANELAAAGRPLRPAQAQAIVWALDRVAARVTADNLAVAEEQLVGLAAQLTPGELRRAGKEIGDLLDSDGPEPDEQKAYARESLTLANAENGVKFRGFLANENAELLRSLIHSGARPHKTVDGELDPRSREKRQADALSATLTVAATATAPATATGTAPATATGTGTATAPATATGTAPATATAATGNGAVPPATPGLGAKANITVTIDFNDLKAATADATGQLVYGDALSAAAVRRLACDANIIPLVLGSNSEPLDVGRSERLVNRAMRRALNARDRGCVVCGAPPIHCDAHHIRSWIDGGPTAITNLALLCRRHHIDLHAGHWTITITNGKVNVSRPTWATPPPTRRPTRPVEQHRRVTPGAPPPTSPLARAPKATPPNDAATASAGPEQGAARAKSAESPRSKWKADDALRQEAARFAVWGDDSIDAAMVSAGLEQGADPLESAESPRSKWKAEDALRQEVARFAVWGDDSTRRTSEESAQTAGPVPDHHAARDTTRPGNPARPPAEATQPVSPATH